MDEREKGLKWVPFPLGDTLFALLGEILALSTRSLLSEQTWLSLYWKQWVGLGRFQYKVNAKRSDERQLNRAKTRKKCPRTRAWGPRLWSQHQGWPNRSSHCHVLPGFFFLSLVCGGCLGWKRNRDSLLLSAGLCSHPTGLAEASETSRCYGKY